MQFHPRSSLRSSKNLVTCTAIKGLIAVEAIIKISVVFIADPFWRGASRQILKETEIYIRYNDFWHFKLFYLYLTVAVWHVRRNKWKVLRRIEASRRNALWLFALPNYLSRPCRASIQSSA
jgi:hypothetical protein